MPRLKIDITKGLAVPNATFFASTRLISFFVETKDVIYVVKVCEKSGTLSSFCVNRDTTGTNAKIPGLSRSFRDTWQL